jgi:hypothetical protein
MKIENILNDEELSNLVGGSFTAVSTRKRETSLARSI